MTKISEILSKHKAYSRTRLLEERLNPNVLDHLNCPLPKFINSEFSISNNPTFLEIIALKVHTEIGKLEQRMVKAVVISTIPTTTKNSIS